MKQHCDKGFLICVLIISLLRCVIKGCTNYSEKVLNFKIDELEIPLQICNNCSTKIQISDSYDVSILNIDPFLFALGK